jgi:hypothetical protein
VWKKPEVFTNADEAIVYFGNALEHLVRGNIPAAIHRVVREPQTLRYSMPFELKPNSETLLVVDSLSAEERATKLPLPTERYMMRRVASPGESLRPATVEYDEITFGRLEIRQSWTRVERSVARTDKQRFSLDETVEIATEENHQISELQGTDLEA